MTDCQSKVEKAQKAFDEASSKAEEAKKYLKQTLFESQDSFYTLLLKSHIENSPYVKLGVFSDYEKALSARGDNYFFSSGVDLFSSSYVCLSVFIVKVSKNELLENAIDILDEPINFKDLSEKMGYEMKQKGYLTSPFFA